MESDNNILDLTVQIACQDKELPSDQELGSWVRAALDGPATLTIRFVDSEEGAALNDQFRQKNSPTNVLTFPMHTKPVMKQTWCFARKSFAGRQLSSEKA